MSVPGTMGRPAYRLYQLAWAGLDWLYPPHCGGCGDLRMRWCNDCQRKTKLVPASICELCGQILDTPGICIRCQTSPPSYLALRAWGVFEGPLQSALHRLKYQGDIALGEVLARPLIDMYHNMMWQVDLVTAVPMGSARKAKRGYNQAALLAMPLALGSSLKYQPRALYKVRETRSQVGLTVAQRRENVAGAYEARTKVVQGKRVLIVDDVTTTGATMEACSLALLHAGAIGVYGLTLSRASSTGGSR